MKAGVGVPAAASRPAVVDGEPGDRVHRLP